MNLETIKTNLFSIINAVRTNPKSLVEVLESQIQLFNNNILYRKNSIPILTSEGPKAFYSAIDFLNDLNPTHLLNYSEILESAANDLASSMDDKNKIAHIDSNGNNLNDRITKYAEWDDICTEAIEIVQNDPINTIIDMIVSDGDKNREKREILFYDQYENIGMSFNRIKGVGLVVVMVLAGKLRNENELAFDYNDFKYDESFALKKTNYQTNKQLNTFQYSDPDAPDNAIDIRIEKRLKHFKNYNVLVTKNIYKLPDGSEDIVEIEEF